jgi:hypothetical protein
MNPPPRLLRVALLAAAQGHHVFPLRRGSKRPMLHGLRQCPRFGDCARGHRGWEQRATRNPAVIRRWWSAWPAAGVGIATGPSGLYVVDLDTGRGVPAPARWVGARHGRDVLAQLARDCGQPYPGGTFTVQTPSGGLHLYYRAPAGSELRNTAGRVGWRIDSRGHGGSIVAAGNTTRHGSYTVVRNDPIAPLPTWLAALFQPPPVEPPPILAGHRPGPERRTRAYLDAVVDGVVTAPDGTAHRTLLAAAVSLGRVRDSTALTESEIVTALRDAAHRRHIPACEAADTIRDGLAYGRERPRTLDS